ncbi:MAG: dihydroorotate dehydrogenase (quinone) [Bacteroidetes bacterium GWF2_41_61]|nr:MAG: dihydroorotate dehydrogenase (quinone) [Bacteroidetes bacterium GWE2_40_15]OFY29919.1 MAG: dihydroorotate dehydrogenase (quinone) [Bacteroidetes bacterium GWF2_41_61]OFY91003.1 MAG: dihydroorotate dehydrogenase (quinone) [Bacteroidetes bacterium RIFOXYA12_FULL_40_10]HBG24576.1 quinone-dependent dihydroorotate dehydrogenase [Rikenellaceae bacterium]HBZ26381.1 quinone-dependent dihydroorotate dehydrogenase [Rikenellaceae bacterium]
MFKILRPILFSFSPETAHNIVIGLLKILSFLPIFSPLLRIFYCYKSPKLEKEVMGIKFKNPIGLAAGFDKNGEVYNQLSDFGFGFIEIGSLTPNEQIGNPKPRCFRLLPDRAIINRMGINNKGVKFAVSRLKDKKSRTVVGANIIKSTSSANDQAPQDYEKSFAQLYDFVDYFVVNVSCPNVKGVTKLQDINSLSEIVDRLTTLRKYFDEYRPILLKVSPDLTFEQLDEIIDLILVSGMDGIVATNTTISREFLTSPSDRVEFIGDGGLSGAPLYRKSLEVVQYIHNKTSGQLPIIAVGGIMTPKQAKEMIDSGASLVQIYTGFIYNGPGFVRRILRHLAKNS